MRRVRPEPEVVFDQQKLYGLVSGSGVLLFKTCHASGGRDSMELDVNGKVDR